VQQVKLSNPENKIQHLHSQQKNENIPEFGAVANPPSRFAPGNMGSMGSIWIHDKQKVHSKQTEFKR
jgi:hypothetical protein